MKTTPNHLIHIGAPIPFDTDWFLLQMKELMNVSYGETGDIRVFQAVCDPPRHCPDIRLAVSPDLRLVAHAAQTDPDIFFVRSEERRVGKEC